MGYPNSQLLARCLATAALLVPAFYNANYAWAADAVASTGADSLDAAPSATPGPGHSDTLQEITVTANQHQRGHRRGPHRQTHSELR